MIDYYSQNDENASYIEARCVLEGSAQPNLPATSIQGTTGPSVKQMTFNGYIQNDFDLTRIGTDFGYDYATEYAPLNQYSYGILSDTPQVGIGGTTLQYAGPHDYGVFSFFNAIFTTFTKPAGVLITGTFANGSTANFVIPNTDANGGTTSLTIGVPNCYESILYFGIFPGNLRQINSTFNDWITDTDNPLVCYDFRLVDTDTAPDDPHDDCWDGEDCEERADPKRGGRETQDKFRNKGKRDEGREDDGEQPICEMCEDYKWRVREGEECPYDTRTECERDNYECEECEEEGTWKWGPDGECIYTDEGECEDAHSSTTNYLSVAHTICITCPNPKGYEPVRITWLNSMGGWDYYTFTMKSSESIKTKRNDWTQLEGTWNQDSWKPQGWKGGKKAFTVNATKTIIVNSDYVSEEVGEWFQKLINSPEIYIIKPHIDWKSQSEINNSYEKYVIAVRLMTSSFKIKTQTNDSIMQYSFKFEESRNLNTQPI